MGIRRITTFAAALGAIVTLLTATTASAAFAATDDGYGPTLAAATMNARITIQGDYGPCRNVTLINDAQLSDGTWWAEVAGSCTAFH